MGTLTMIGRTVALALVGSAAAFSPMLRANPASAGMDKSARAPSITVLDHRGCTAHDNTEYTGAKANSQDDEMCVVVRNPKVAVSQSEAAKFLQQVISYQAKGIDGSYTGVVKKV